MNSVVKPTSIGVALFAASTLFVNTLGVAHATDPETRRPLYVITLSKYHHNDQEWNDPRTPGKLLGQSPYSGGIAPDNNRYWGHWVKFNLQILDNNGEPYGKGNPAEEFHNYNENPTYASLIDDYTEGQMGYFTCPPGQSTFTDNNALVRGNPFPGSQPSTFWFRVDQRWIVYVRTGEGAHPNVEGNVYRTDSVHRLTATQADVARQNLGGTP